MIGPLDQVLDCFKGRFGVKSFVKEIIDLFISSKL
jgi:hypothetical protein